MHTLHTYIHAYIHTYIRLYVRTYVRTYIHTYVPTYLHTYIPTYLHTYIPTYLHTYIPTYLHTYIPTYIHTYIHAYPCRSTSCYFLPRCIMRKVELRRFMRAPLFIGFAINHFNNLQFRLVELIVRPPYTLLYYTILHYTILFYDILYHTIHYTKLYYTIHMMSCQRSLTNITITLLSIITNS